MVDGRKLSDITTVKESREAFSWDSLWELFDGNEDNLNIAHECIDRHIDKGTGVRIVMAEGGTLSYSFRELSDWSSRFANFLERAGVNQGDRVAIMLHPSLPFYAAMFGAIKRGAIAVPMFTLFGPEALALRLNDCHPTILLVEENIEEIQKKYPDIRVIRPDSVFMDKVRAESPSYTPDTSSQDLAIFQYTSGTTRGLPEAVKHTHRAAVTIMISVLYSHGLRLGDVAFAPSSPAWGHGLWQRCIGPLTLGITVHSYSGKFDPKRVLEALEELRVTNFSAAATVFRMIRESGLVDNYTYFIKKLSYSGEAMDAATAKFVEEKFNVKPCSSYGSTEVGSIIGNFPGFTDYEVRDGSLGLPIPGREIAILDKDGNILPPGETGEITVKKRGSWFPVKDRGYMDEDGYIYYSGRSDDVIISAGWTMSAREIEDTLEKHPDIREAAIIAVPDEIRGLIAKAYIVSSRESDEFVPEIQTFCKENLSRHEYPRAVEFIDALPRNDAGKVHRKVLKDMAGVE